MSDEVMKGIIGDGFLTEFILTVSAKQLGSNPSEFYIACNSEDRQKNFVNITVPRLF